MTISLEEAHEEARVLVKVFFGTLLCVISTACGRSYPSVTVSSSLSHFENASLRCANLNECPESTGEFVFQTMHSEGLCTGSLITARVVLTNSHCIPDEFKDGNYLGGTRAKMVFAPSALLPAESISVRRILEYSVIEQSTGHPFGKSPDYALLELENPVFNRIPIQVSPAGLPEDFLFDLHAVTPDSKNGMEGLLQIKHCRTTMRSAYQPSYDNPFAAVVSFSDCEIVHGNSGSAMVDPQGFMRGIVHAGLDPASRVRLAKQFDLPALGPLFLGTNLACLPMFNSFSNIPAACMVPVPQMDAPEGIRFFLNESASTNSNANSFRLDEKLRRRPFEPFSQ